MQIKIFDLKTRVIYLGVFNDLVYQNYYFLFNQMILEIDTHMKLIK